jgi:hypothetical protein
MRRRSDDNFFKTPLDNYSTISYRDYLLYIVYTVIIKFIIF